MAYEPKDGQATLFKNAKKKDGDNLPEYRGEIMLNGEVKEIAFWVKTSEKGNKWMSGKVSDKFVPNTDNPPATSEPESDLPF